MVAPPVRICLTPRVSGKEDVFLVRSYERRAGVSDVLFQALPEGFAYSTFVFTDRPEDAEYFLAPHPIRALDASGRAYLESIRSFVSGFDKPVLIFAAGDYHHRISIPDMVVLKASQYRTTMHTNEIIIPCASEDLGVEVGIEVRNKPGRPRVGFCGYSSFASTGLYVKYLIRVAGIFLASLVVPGVRVYQRGIYWRRLSMAKLRKDSRIDTAFIMRNSFSQSAKLISADPRSIRSEYLQNMKDSDFALTPKGDANISIRFYEALSMGRIPVLIDTLVPLPCESQIAYDDFVVRVPYADVARIGDYVMDFVNRHTDVEFRAVQRKARAAFTEYLRYDAFFNWLVTSGTLRAAARSASTAARATRA